MHVVKSIHSSTVIDQVLQNIATNEHQSDKLEFRDWDGGPDGELLDDEYEDDDDHNIVIVEDFVEGEHNSGSDNREVVESNSNDKHISEMRLLVLIYDT